MKINKIECRAIETQSEELTGEKKMGKNEQSPHNICVGSPRKGTEDIFEEIMAEIFKMLMKKVKDPSSSMNPKYTDPYLESPESKC